MTGRTIEWKNKISDGVKKLWENQEYRDSQTAQRNNPRGEYRTGIKRDKLKISINLELFKKDYLEGIKIKDILIKNKISLSTMYRIIKENNICKRRN